MEKVNLGEYVSIKTGKLDANASDINGKYPFFTCSNEPLKINNYSYDCECVLVAGNGDLNVKYYNGKFDAYQRTYIIESKDKQLLNTKYLYYLISSNIERLRKNAIGGVIKYIKLEALLNIKLRLINIESQLAIVNKLDRIQETKDLRNNQIKELDRLVQSRFVDMFGMPGKNEKNFKIVKLKECISNIDTGKSFICESFARKNDYPAILKLSAVTHGYFNQYQNKALIKKEMFIPKNEIHKGDLLFTRKNTPELVGMSAFVYETKPNLMLPDIIFRINTLECCNKIYLWKLINHELFRNKIMSISNGSAKSMSNISKANLMNLEILLPPIKLQNQFASIVRKIDKQKFGLENSLEEIKNLQESLMNKYFGG